MNNVAKWKAEDEKKTKAENRENLIPNYWHRITAIWSLYTETEALNPVCTPQTKQMKKARKTKKLLLSISDSSQKSTRDALTFSFISIYCWCWLRVVCCCRTTIYTIHNRILSALSAILFFYIVKNGEHIKWCRESIAKHFQNETWK